MSRATTDRTTPAPQEPELSPNAITVLRERYLVRDENGQVVEKPAELFWRAT